MAGSNGDRSDYMRALRDQASRVYIQTIAANEREDRLLHKKLDAIDLEHRAQYLKMKKWIQDAQINRNKRLTKMQSNLTKCSADKAKEIPVDPALKFKNETDKTGGNKTRIERAMKGQTESAIEERLAKEHCAELSETLEQNNPLERSDRLQLISTKRRASAMLQDRVDYTKSEVAHLKASFAGQRTPPNLRRRTFLPHLEEGANTMIGSGKKKRTGRRKRKEPNNNSVADKLNKMILGDVAHDNEKLPKISLLKTVTPNDKVIDVHITRAVKS